MHRFLAAAGLNAGRRVPLTACRPGSALASPSCRQHLACCLPTHRFSPHISAPCAGAKSTAEGVELFYEWPNGVQEVYLSNK